MIKQASESLLADAENYEAQILSGEGVDKYMPRNTVTQTMRTIEKKYSTEMEKAQGK